MDDPVLELGCGPDYVWRDNLHRIPPAWDVTLSDFSAEMLAQAQDNRAELTRFIEPELAAHGAMHITQDGDISTWATSSDRRSTGRECDDH